MVIDHQHLQDQMLEPGGPRGEAARITGVLLLVADRATKALPETGGNRLSALPETGIAAAWELKQYAQ